MRKTKAKSAVETKTASAAFHPKLRSMNVRPQPYFAATIRTGGAAKWVRVPPTETFTKRSPSVPYFSLVEGFSS